MADLAAVPSPEEIEDAQLTMFEGEPVSRYRLDIAKVPQMAAVLDNSPLLLNRKDTVLIEVEARVAYIAHGAASKGGTDTQPLARIAIAKVIPGSERIIGAFDLMGNAKG